MCYLNYVTLNIFLVKMYFSWGGGVLFVKNVNESLVSEII